MYVLRPIRKTVSTCLIRVPLAFADEISFDCSAHWDRLLPEGLPHPFTAKVCYRASNLSARGRSGWSALNILEYMGVVVRCGKQGSAILWQVAALADF